MVNAPATEAGGSRYQPNQSCPEFSRSIVGDSVNGEAASRGLRAPISSHALITAGAGVAFDAAARPEPARLMPRNDAPNQEHASAINFRRFNENLLRVVPSHGRGRLENVIL
jgi:hypothetical protein